MTLVFAGFVAMVKVGCLLIGVWVVIKIVKAFLA